MNLIKFYLALFIISLSLSKLAFATEDFLDYKLDIIVNTDNDISKKNVAEDEIIKGTLFGKIKNTSYKAFKETTLECDLLGRSYKGRGFSCGFAVVEDLNGLCYFNNSNSKDILITSWKCSTTAGLDGDAYCKGKLSIIQGFGKFAGVLGFGEIEMPLAKTLISNKQSYPMRLTMKIKYPSNIKKN
ncbi:MAG: hypothetical protein CMJ08_02140 [Pelagibacterales bacterium]|nr:hypothetical protein [Pelagibacterales bacterium]|tara:strand:- start:1404 stop:1961 length:558 start_codon:yes stop_codon:yes gene_type:complete